MKDSTVLNPVMVVHFTKRHIGGLKCREIAIDLVKQSGIPTLVFDEDAEVTIIDQQLLVYDEISKTVERK